MWRHVTGACTSALTSTARQTALWPIRRDDDDNDDDYSDSGNKNHNDGDDDSDDEGDITLSHTALRPIRPFIPVARNYKRQQILQFNIIRNRS